VEKKDPGQDAVDFFRKRLTHTKGIYARKYFELLGWQDRIIRDIFGTLKSNGLRQYTTAYVEVPKKNGKTEVAAGIALMMLLLDEEQGSEVYFAASTRDQAGIGFRVAAQMVRNDKVLNDMCRIVDSTKTIYLADDPNCFMKAISADAGTQDGINPHCAVFDELHRQKNSDLWDVLSYGMATRTQPLLFAITTAGISGESPICEDQHNYARMVLEKTFKDPSYYPVIYGLDSKDDWTFEGEPAARGREATGWYRANPSLGYHLPIDKVREEFAKARANLSQQNSFRRLRLDQWVGQETRYIPMDDWKACGEPFDVSELAGCKCYGGLDLSSKIDLTAFVLIFEKDGCHYWLPHFWIPEEGIEQRSKQDKVPYSQWAAQGLITLTEGNEIDYRRVGKTIIELSHLYDIVEIGYDDWKATEIVHTLMDEALTMVPLQQGSYKSMHVPTDSLLGAVMARKVRHNGNPILTWNADCMTVKTDPEGRVKPCKPDRRKSSKRIDGIVAGINAMARMIVHEDSESIYNYPQEVWVS
jgi:phage terminase large subunit-like protein